MNLSVEFKAPKLSVVIPSQNVNINVGIPVVKEYVDAEPYIGPYEIEPSGVDQSFETTGKRFTDNLTVTRIDPEYVGSDIPRQNSLEVNGLNVTAYWGFFSDTVTVSGVPNLESQTVTPTETTQTVSYGSSYDGLSSVTVNAIDSNYIGSGVTQQNTLTVSGNTVSNLIGYYSSVNSATVDSAVWKSATSATVTPTLTINTNNGLIKANVSSGHMITPIQTDGWALHTTHYTINIKGSDTLQLTTVSSTTITPTETVQTAVESRRYTVGTVKVAAIPSTYVGSAITTQTYLTPLGNTVSAQAGYYPNTTTATVQDAEFRSTSQFTWNPTVTVASDGTVTATISSSGNLSPIRFAGWVTDSQTFPFTVSGSTQTTISDPNLISSNLRAGVTLFGTTGNIMVPTITHDTATKTVTFAF